MRFHDLALEGVYQALTTKYGTGFNEESSYVTIDELYDYAPTMMSVVFAPGANRRNILNERLPGKGLVFKAGSGADARFFLTRKGRGAASAL